MTDQSSDTDRPPPDAARPVEGGQPRAHPPNRGADPAIAASHDHAAPADGEAAAHSGTGPARRLRIPSGSLAIAVWAVPLGVLIGAILLFLLFLLIPNDTSVLESAVPEQVREQVPEQAPEKPEPPVGILAAGEFSGSEYFHGGAGKVTVAESPSGGTVLRISDFSVTEGPGLEVLLVKATKVENSDDVIAAEWQSLGPLRSLVGNQEYPLPEDVSIADYGYVVIWSRPFGLLFAIASLVQDATTGPTVESLEGTQPDVSGPGG